MENKDFQISIERRNRIRLSIFAYAYEVENVSLISDHEYDELSLRINIKQKTGNKIMDRFFIKEFNPSTGMWVYNHPQLERIKQLYLTVFKNENTIKKIKGA